MVGEKVDFCKKSKTWKTLIVFDDFESKWFSVRMIVLAILWILSFFFFKKKQNTTNIDKIVNFGKFQKMHHPPPLPKRGLLEWV